MPLNSLLRWFTQPRWKPLLFGFLGLVGGVLAALLVGEPLWLFLRPPPALPPAPELRLAASPEVVVDQDGRNRFNVQIVRDLFSGPVRVSCGNLPPGVRAPDVVIPPEQTTAELELQADSEAAASIQAIRILAQAENVSRAETATTLRIVTPPRPQVDVVFVLDVTGSMQNQIDGVRQSIVDFARELQTGKLDARIGLVAFRDRLIDPPEEAEVLSFGDGPFTTDYRRFQEEVGRLTASGGGDPPESSMDALALAARQPFRPSANKVLLLITDAPPKTPDKEMHSINEVGDVLRDHKINQVHLIVREEERSTFEPLQAVAPGNYFDLTAVSRTRDSFARFLPTVGRAVARQALATQTPRRVPVAAPPPPPAKGIQSSQEFAAESGGRLLLVVSLWTGVLAAGICLALTTGQGYYIRHSWPRPLEILKGVGGGLLAGFLAGVAGQMLFQVLPPNPGLEPLLHAGGWAILGALVGLGMAFLVPNLSLSKGTVSGALGGLLASLSFQALTVFFRGAAADLAGRLLSAAILGLCLGLVVAVVEIIFRRFWLQVTDASGATRLVNLGAQPVFVGGDPRSCTVHVPQAPARALRFLVREGRVECLDVVKEQTFVVSPGYRRQLAAATLVVCGQAGASPGGGNGAPPPAAQPSGANPAAVPVQPSAPAPPGPAGTAGWWLRLESGRTLALAPGTRLTAADLPGLDPQAGIDTAEVTAHPSRPGELGLANRSRQVWSVSLSGAEYLVEPGRSIKLIAGALIQLGKLRGEFLATSMSRVPSRSGGPVG